LNPYEPVANVDDSVPVATSSERLEWEGHSFTIAAKQIPLSLWTVAWVSVQVNDESPFGFVKWRWNKRVRWLLQHRDQSLVFEMHFSGASPIHCRLFVDGSEVGTSETPSKNFSLGLAAVALITGAITLTIAKLN
jgi:hypothetical protein